MNIPSTDGPPQDRPYPTNWAQVYRAILHQTSRKYWHILTYPAQMDPPTKQAQVCRALLHQTSITLWQLQTYPVQTVLHIDKYGHSTIEPDYSTYISHMAECRCTDIASLSQGQTSRTTTTTTTTWKSNNNTNVNKKISQFMYINPFVVVTMSLSTPVINHTSLEHHYTKSVSHIEICTYTHDRPTPPINHKYLEHHYTESVSHIEECTS